MSNIKNMSQVLALSYILMMFANPALGISVSHETNGVSSSASYHLDTSASLKDVSELGESTISRTGQLSGSRNNEYRYQTSANGASVNGAVQSSGTLSATISSIASAEGSILSQAVDGSGDLSAAISGSSGSVAAGQNAGIANGAIATSQSVASSGDVVVAGQNTQMNGDGGSILSTAGGEENLMEVSGGGDASDPIRADLQAFAGPRASVTGHIYSGNDVVIDGENLQQIASESDTGLQVSRDYYALGNYATFGATAVNSVALSAWIPSSNDVATGGYKFSGFKWRGTSPYVKMVVDTGNKGSGITGVDFGSAMYNAASTWNSAKSGLFGGFQSGVVGSTASRNSKNEIGWSTSLASTTLAMNTAWSSSGYAVESDVMFNRNLKWTKSATSNPRISPFDAQATGLHELGHVLGLDDLSLDNYEIMRQSKYRATTVGRTLGTGDKNGIKKLYSPV